MKNKIEQIKKWMIINKGYLMLMLITIMITIIGLILGLEAGAAAGTACVILVSFANIYNWITNKEKIDLKEIIYCLIGMIFIIMIYLLMII